jgi:hypothetical protein
VGVEVLTGAMAQHFNEAFLVTQVPEVWMVGGYLAVLKKFEHT